jgi:hypothetical protein
MPIFQNDEERRAYIMAAKAAMVKPKDIQGYLDIVDTFTLKMFEDFGNICCARYNPATLDKMGYTEFVDCSFCLYFFLWCDICPVEYYSKQVAEGIIGERICNIVEKKTMDETIDSTYFNDKIIAFIRDGGIDFMRNGGFDAWKEKTLEKLKSL